MDKQYDIADLIDDTLDLIPYDAEEVKYLNSEELFEMVCTKVGIVNLEGEEAVNAFRKETNDMFIGQRFVALTALREGITLDGKTSESRKLSYFLSRCFLLTHVVLCPRIHCNGFGIDSF
jgi:hypothetical protein